MMCFVLSIFKISCMKIINDQFFFVKEKRFKFNLVANQWKPAQIKKSLWSLAKRKFIRCRWFFDIKFWEIDFLWLKIEMIWLNSLLTHDRFRKTRERIFLPLNFIIRTVICQSFFRNDSTRIVLGLDSLNFAWNTSTSKLTSIIM